MLFHLLHFWISLALRVWYKKVYYHFDESLPEDAPIIFASTHPNSAIDYLFPPIITRKRTFVLVRGDVFKNKFLDRIFRAIYMLPVYRFRDGYASLNLNQGSFESCYEHFDQQGRVLIFSEGICIQKKLVQPLRKGTARLALNYLAQRGGEKIYIVPVSSSYTRFRHFRASVMVNFGKPIDAREYLPEFEQNANSAYAKLTADVERAMRSNFVEVPRYEDESNEEYSFMAMRLSRKDERKNWMIKDRALFEDEKQMAEELRQSPLPTTVASKLSALTTHALSATDEGLLTNGSTIWQACFKLILLAPLMLAAGLSVVIPFIVGKWLVSQKIKDVIFFSTVMVMGGAVLYVLQFLSLLMIGLLFWGAYGVALPIITLLFTLIGVELVDVFIAALQRIRRTNKLEELESLHEELMAWRNT